MKNFDEILEKLQIDFEDDIPGLLTAESLDDLAEYVVGSSRDPDKTSLCIYFEDGTYSADQNILKIIIQLQLPGITFLNAAKYTDVIFDYIKNYNPENIDFNFLDNIEYEFWPIEQEQTTFVYLVPTYVQQLDSCD